MRHLRFMICSLGLSLGGGFTPAAQIESYGSFVSGGAVASLGGAQVVDAIDGGIVAAQNSVSYVARNGWMASRILVVAPAGSEQQALIVEQPVDVTAVPGTIARFRVGAVSGAELRYQWRRDGVSISGANSASLGLPNVSNVDEGSYDVVVETSAGSVVSAGARLTVVNRFLSLESVQTTNFTGNVTVPVFFSGDGSENAVSFSVAYGSMGLTLAGINSVGATTVTTNSTVGGAVGLGLALGHGETFPAGTNHLADLVFLPSGITNQIILNLALSKTPVPLLVLDGASNSLPVVSRNGLITFRQPVSTVADPGSGGFSDDITLITPDDGSGGALFVRVLIHDLGVDSLGNPIGVLNAAGTNENGVPFVLFPGSVQPGQSLDLALEYYVSDRVTAPNPRFEVETLTDSFVDLPDGLEVVPLSRGLVVGGKFYVDFVTEAGRTYYVQYRDQDVAGIWQTSLPALTGDGSFRQWIDNGPPATGAKLVNTGARFYRVVRAP